MKKQMVVEAAKIKEFSTLKPAAIQRQLVNLIATLMVSIKVGGKIVKIIDALRTPKPTVGGMDAGNPASILSPFVKDKILSVLNVVFFRFYSDKLTTRCILPDALLSFLRAASEHLCQHGTFNNLPPALASRVLSFAIAFQCSLLPMYQRTWQMLKDIEENVKASKNYKLIVTDLELALSQERDKVCKEGGEFYTWLLDSTYLGDGLLADGVPPVPVPAGEAGDAAAAGPAAAAAAAAPAAPLVNRTALWGDRFPPQTYTPKIVREARDHNNIVPLATLFAFLFERAVYSAVMQQTAVSELLGPDGTFSCDPLC